MTPDRLPAAGKSLYGKTWVSDGTATVDIPIDVPDDPNPQWIRAALWWPEPPVLNGNNPVDTHNDIDLSIVSPGWFGSVVANSTGSDGVFERTEYLVPAHQGGKWILRIHAYQMRTAYQAVYWSASLGD